MDAFAKINDQSKTFEQQCIFKVTKTEDSDEQKTLLQHHLMDKVGKTKNKYKYKELV